MVNQATNESPREGALQTNNMAPALNDSTCSQGRGETNNDSNMCIPQEFMNILISYDINQLAKPNA